MLTSCTNVGTSVVDRVGTWNLSAEGETAQVVHLNCSGLQTPPADWLDVGWSESAERFRKTNTSLGRDGNGVGTGSPDNRAGGWHPLRARRKPGERR